MISTGTHCGPGTINHPLFVKQGVGRFIRRQMPARPSTAIRSIVDDAAEKLATVYGSALADNINWQMMERMLVCV